MKNWLSKYQQGGDVYNPGNATSIHGINMYNPQQVTNPDMSITQGAQPNPWALNNPNSEEVMDDVYAGRDRQAQAPQDQSYLKTTTKRTFGTPNWGYIAASNMVGEGLGFLANQGKNSSQNAMKRYNDQKLDPLNTLMTNPNTSAQDQAGSGYYKMGGWISKYQDGGEFDDDDEEYLFGFDDIEESQEAPEAQYLKRKNLQAQYAQEDQENMTRQMQQEAFFSSLVNSDPNNQSDNYSQYNNSSSSEKFVPEEREKQAYDFFKQKGLPDHIAAGIVGNLKYESNFDVTGVGDGGKARGLAQWHPDRYSKLQQQGFNMNSFEGNLEAIAHELTTSEKNALNALMKAKTPQEAAAVFDRKYERSAGLSTGKRAARAAQILNSYQEGGIIEDPMGQWNHPGEVTRIPSNQITMEGVNYPVLGISDTGHTQMMQPGQDYSFDGESVTEYPMMQKGGSWTNKYKQVADNNSSQYIPKTVEEYNQLNPNLKEQEFLASHPTQQFIPYVTPTSTYHKEAIDNKKKEIERILFTNEGRHSDGEYKFLRKPRPELNKWVDQIGLPVLEGASLIGGVGEGYQLLKATGKLGRLGLIKSLGKDILEKPSNVLKNNKVVQGVDNTLTAVGNRANVLGLDPVGAMIDHQVKGLNTAVNVNWMWDNNTRQYVPNFNGSAINVAGKYTSDLYDGIGTDKITSPLNAITDLNIVKGTINPKGQPFPVSVVDDLKSLPNDMQPYIGRETPDFKNKEEEIWNKIFPKNREIRYNPDGSVKKQFGGKVNNWLQNYKNK